MTPTEPEITFEGLATRAFALVRANPVPLALPLVLLGILGGIGDGGPMQPEWNWRPTTFAEAREALPLLAGIGALALVALVAMFILYSLLTVLVVHAGVEAIEGRAPNLSVAWAAEKTRILPAAGTFFLALLAVLAGLVLLIVPGLIVLSALVPLAAVVVAERKTGVAALSRAWEIARGHKGKLFLVILAILLVEIVAEAAFGWLPFLGGIIAGAIGGFMSALATAIGVVFYKARAGATSPALPSAQ